MNIIRKTLIKILIIIITLTIILPSQVSFEQPVNFELDPQTSTPLKYHNLWGGSGHDRAEAIIKDSNGNIYIGGYTNSYGAGGYDFFYVKYSNSGQKIIEKTWGGVNDDFCHDLAVDSLNNVYLVGVSFSFGEATLVKFDEEGILDWAWTKDDYRLYGIDMDSLNNIYVAGEFQNGSNNEYFLAKFNSFGEQQWNKTWGGEYDDDINAITLDSNNNIYATCITESLSSYYLALAKYNSSGDLVWYNTWEGVGTCHSIALDSIGNIYTTGYSNNDDFILLKHDNAGILQWNKTWGGINSDEGTGIAIDNQNIIYVTGVTYRYGEASYGNDIFGLIYDQSGRLIDSFYWGEDPNDYATDLIVDSSGIYISGVTASFGASGSGDACLIVFDPFKRIGLDNIFFALILTIMVILLAFGSLFILARRGNRIQIFLRKITRKIALSKKKISVDRSIKRQKASSTKKPILKEGKIIKLITIDESKSDFSNYLDLAHEYSKKGNYKKSIECWEKVTQLKPGFQEAWVLMGEEYEKLKNKEKAIECYDKALEYGPFDQANYNKERLFKGKRIKTQRKKVRELFDKINVDLPRCVRCGSEENLERYFHITPDYVTFKRVNKYTTRYTIHGGTGGSGYVPVCASCIKAFSRGKSIKQFIGGGIALASVLGCMMGLLWFLDWNTFISLPVVLPIELIQGILGISIGFGILCFIAYLFISDFSSLRPRRVISIRPTAVRVRPKKVRKWIPIDEWTSGFEPR